MRVRRFYLRHRFIVAGLAVLAAVTFTSCGKDNCAGTQQDDGCPVADTPDHLVQALACAYETKDIDMYEHLLDDQYLFYFVVEVADSLGLPQDEPWWGKTKDVRSTGKLFADTSAQFTVEFEAVGEGWTSCEAERGDTSYVGLCRRYIPILTFHVENPGEEPITYFGDDSYVDFVVIPHALFEGHFAILEIREVERLPKRLLVTTPFTLSALKAWYR